MENGKTEAITVKMMVIKKNVANSLDLITLSSKQANTNL